MPEIVRRPESLPSPFSDNHPAIVEAFLAAQDVKQTSKETYRRQLMQFLTYLREKRIYNPTRETILAFKTALISKGLSSLTVNSYHSLRHTFATLALQNGAPVVQVKEAMRHKDVSTTMVYVHLMNRLKNAAERYIDF